jgi:hypothetical protein
MRLRLRGILPSLGGVDSRALLSKLGAASVSVVDEADQLEFLDIHDHDTICRSRYKSTWVSIYFLNATTSSGDSSAHSKLTAADWDIAMLFRGGAACESISVPSVGAYK